VSDDQHPELITLPAFNGSTVLVPSRHVLLGRPPSLAGSIPDRHL
jgi:hypothetical protein